VYLLGGEKAVPKAMETGLDGFKVKRLGGATRYATNLLILNEAGVAGKDILVCTGKGFADSLSASAAKQPILLVKDNLDNDQKNFLSKASGKIYIIGGTSAVSTRIESQLKTYGTIIRLGGATRYVTSVMVAEEFFKNPTAAVLAYSENFPDGLSGGALACGIDAPLILVKGGKDADAAKYTKAQGIKTGYVLGGTGLIPDRVVRNVFSMATADPITIIK
jgi:putative cell wall-binding protein